MLNNGQINNIELEQTCNTHIKIFLVIILNHKKTKRERERGRIFQNIYKIIQTKWILHKYTQKQESHIYNKKTCNNNG